MATSRFNDAHDAFTFMIRYEERNGESPGGIGNSWGKIGEALSALGRHSEAIPCFQRGLKMMATAHGMLALLEHTIHDIRSMQAQLQEMGMDSSALDDVLAGFTPPSIAFSEQAKSAYQDVICNEAYLKSAVSARIELGKLLQQIGQVDEAAITLGEGLAFSDAHPESVTPRQHIDLLHELGTTYLTMDALDIAEPLLSTASELRRAQGMASGWSDLGLARIASARKHHEKAARLGRDAVANTDDFQRADAMLVFADILDAAGQDMQAAEVRGEAQALLAEH